MKRQQNTNGQQAGLGFTFIEVIVTALIIAVLSIVATQLYRGFLVNSAQDTVNQLAQTAAASANDFRRRTGQNPNNVNELRLSLPQPGRYVIIINAAANPPTITVQDNQYRVIGIAQY
ncbi:MAG: hypothetical protein JW795_15170 [Chitinivibrionales bacterium]|nr:hypothetical protein [Chitinivibrionales bacterium]